MVNLNSNVGDCFVRCTRIRDFGSKPEMWYGLPWPAYVLGVRILDRGAELEQRPQHPNKHHILQQGRRLGI